MRKLLLLLLLLPAAAHAQFASILCAPATPCSSTTGPANTGTGDPAWKAFGRINENFTSIGSIANPAFSAIASATNTTAAMVVGTGSTLSATGTGSINATLLNNSTFAAPSPIGSLTPNTAVFSGLTVPSGGQFTLGSITGANQCLHTNSTGVVTGTGVDCAAGSGTVDTGVINTLAFYPASTAEVASLALGAGMGINSGALVPVQVINAQTGTSYAILASDAAKLVTFSNSSPIAVTLSQATATGFGAGFAFDVFNSGAGTVTITPNTSTINGLSTLTLTTNTGCSISSDGANYQVSACTASLTTLPALTTASALVSIGTITTGVWNGTTIAVANGGTGDATLTNHGVLLGKGTSAVGSVAAMAADTVLQGQGASADPAAVTINDCAGASNALTYSQSTHSFGCGTPASGGSGIITFNMNSVAAGGSAFICPSATGASLNDSCLIPMSGTIEKLYIYLVTAATTGSPVFTVYYGAPTSATATTITCSVTVGQHNCNDATHTQAATASNSWAIKVDNSANGSATGLIMVGLQYGP